MTWVGDPAYLLARQNIAMPVRQILPPKGADGPTKSVRGGLPHDSVGLCAPFLLPEWPASSIVRTQDDASAVQLLGVRPC